MIIFSLLLQNNNLIFSTEFKRFVNSCFFNLFKLLQI